MRIFLAGVVFLVALCRFALGGEVAAASSMDPTGTMFRLLTDFGALGAFIIFLICDRKAERKRRDEDSKRWHDLDQALVSLVEKCTIAITESTSVMTEVRKDLWRLGASSRSDRPLDVLSNIATKKHPGEG